MSNLIGKRDGQTVAAGGKLAAAPNIDGVRICAIGNVPTRSGWMAEVFRDDWPGVAITPKQVN